MRAVFLGTPPAAVPALIALVGAGHEVPLVVTQPDRPVGRGRTRQPPAVKRAAAILGLRVEQPERARDGVLRSMLEGCVPDILVVVAYGKILPPSVLQVAVRGAMNVHFSLLPAYRGAAPVQWALARGETVTGVTTMRMEEGLDSGAVYLQRGVEIGDGEHAPALQARLADLGADLLLETLAGIEAGTVEPVPQDDARASHAPRLRREDGEWDPAWTAAELEGRVRGFDPWPGVWGRRGRGRIRIVEGRAVPGEATGEEQGRVVVFERERFLLACAGRTVFEILAVQPEGRRVLRATEARNGRQLAEGDRLERPATAR